MLLLVHEYIILIKYIHCFEGRSEILWDSSVGRYVLEYHYNDNLSLSVES